VHDIDSALEVIRARDAAAARLANGLWGAIRTGAAHPDKVTRYDVQGVCWGALPMLTRRPDSAAVIGDRHAAAALLAELLELLGYQSYAEICRGPTTRDILNAAEDVDRCTALATTAWRESGIEPPDTPVLAWAQVRGPVEQALHAGAGRILEEAIDGGFVDLGSQDAERQRVNLTMKILASPADNLPGTWFSQVFEERLTSWLTHGGSQTRRELLVRIRPEVAQPPESSPCNEFPALQTLLEACHGDGLRLTRNGYLPTALVAELIELMPACADYPATGRSESSWPPVTALRDLAGELGLVRATATRLRLTPLGRDRVEDPDSLVMSVGEGVVSRDASVRGVIEEVIFAVLLLEDSPDRDRLLGKVAVVIEEEGWEASVQVPSTRTLCLEFGKLFLRRLHVLGALDVDPSGRHVGLSEAGRAAASWALRARVMLREVGA